MVAESDLSTIRSWLSKQNHIPQTVDDLLLSRFLHVCDGSLQRTKAVIELFFKLRTEAPEFFANRDPTSPRIQSIFNLIDLLPLPKLTPEGYRCFLYRLSDTNPDNFHYTDYVKTFFMVGDTRLRTEKELVAGEVPIFDMTGWSLRHLTRIPLPSLRKYMQYSQEAHPVKLRQIHIINAVPILDKVLSFIRPFMKSEVAAMMHVHPVGSDSLYKFVPKEILPEEYGGLAGPANDIKERWKKMVEAEREWFLKDEWLATESKRLGKSNTTSHMEGSFRSLTID
ncbi:alpha-tocopherol transfer protein-like [Macrosteles quadrilineatus]|uniref:alpha-tocopherol transfer protein-like n=1 Tax=Macrosteles quadrilineatus TaxID=74068 RepID=UPI0023E296FF|nr:alpha-tocopherol transfer protein-like [Macrosteles quadrilineatus]